MTRDEIEKYIQKKEAVSHRNYMAYQETGISRYMRRHEIAEDEIQIARQALSAADDHEKVGRMGADIAMICSRAIRILHTKDDPTPFLRDLQALGSLYHVNNPYKEGGDGKIH